MHETYRGKIPSHETFSRGSDQGIIPEILGQFLIFIISKCVSVIILTYMHVTFRGGGVGLIPSHGAFSRGSVSPGDNHRNIRSVLDLYNQ